MDVIVTHESADFDGVACLVAARRLYEGSVAIRPAVLDRSVRDYVRLHDSALGLLDGSSVRVEDVSRLVVVDTSDPSRCGRFAELAMGSGVELVTFDHHGEGAAGSDEGVASTDGALITTLVGILAERRLEIQPAEATLFALAIHQDTGSLTFETTTARDVEALAFCYRRGADLGSVERYTRVPLGSVERDVLQQLLSTNETLDIDGVAVQVAVTSCDTYPDGAAHIVDRLMDLLEARALVCLFEYDDRTFCIIRSRGAALEAGTLATALGGGGHRHAAAATLKADLAESRRMIERSLPAAITELGTARDIMSSPARFVTPETVVRDAIGICRRARVGGLMVGTESDLRGVVSREDLDGAMSHDLANAPVKAVMGHPPRRVSGSETVHELRRHLAQSGVDRIAVVDEDRVVGVVTRRDLLGAAEASARGSEQPVSGRVVDVVSAIAPLRPVLAALDDVGEATERVFLVGGAVRDALLDAPVVDIDLAVEGSGIELARRLASKLEGRATPYGDFGTATVTFGEDAVDVASTRSEFYASPGALPSVEDASIESDLFRRDFTINAMAIELDSTRRGRLVDPFGGEGDLTSGTLRVLHGLSFVDDPTRLLRAARYEARYGFRLDGGSETLARGCVALGLVGRLSGTRIGNELSLVLREEAGLDALGRLDELGVARALHPALDAGAQTIATMRAVEALNEETRAGALRWRLRFALLTRRFSSSERYRWLDDLQLARRDVEVIAQAAALPDSLVRESESLDSARELHNLLSPAPVEAVVVALADAPKGSSSATNLRRFLTELRHVELSINGDDLAGLGLPESPAVGRILDAVLGLKLEGSVKSAEDERAAARGMIEAGELE